MGTEGLQSITLTSGSAHLMSDVLELQIKVYLHLEDICIAALTAKCIFVLLIHQAGFPAEGNLIRESSSAH